MYSPADISTLTPFNHNRVYVLLGQECSNQRIDSIAITALKGRGSKSVVVPVIRLEKKDTTIHKLAARSLLEDLERGRSHLHVGPNKLYTGTQEEKTMVRQEAEAIACKWSLVSKWSSFFLVEEPYEPKERDPFMDGVIEVSESIGDDLLQPRGSAAQPFKGLGAGSSPRELPDSELDDLSTTLGAMLRVGGIVSPDVGDDSSGSHLPRGPKLSFSARSQTWKDIVKDSSNRKDRRESVSRHPHSVTYHLDTNLNDMEGILSRPLPLTPMDADLKALRERRTPNPRARAFDEAETASPTYSSPPDSWSIQNGQNSSETAVDNRGAEGVFGAASMQQYQHSGDHYLMQGDDATNTQVRDNREEARLARVGYRPPDSLTHVPHMVQHHYSPPTYRRSSYSVPDSQTQPLRKQSRRSPSGHHSVSSVGPYPILKNKDASVELSDTEESLYYEREASSLDTILNPLGPRSAWV